MKRAGRIQTAAPPIAGGPPPKPTTWTTLRYGDHGESVKAVQRVLHVAADGDFGPLTLAGVKTYQRAHALVPTASSARSPRPPWA